MTSWFIHDINSALCHGSMNIAQQSSFSHFRLARLKRMCRFSSCDQQRCRIWSSYFDENWEILTINSFKKHSHHLWCPCTFRRRFLPLHALPAQHFSSANFIQLYNLEVYIFFIWSWDRVYPEFGYTHPELMYTVGLKVGIGDGIGIGDKAGSHSLIGCSKSFERQVQLALAVRQRSGYTLCRAATPTSNIKFLGVS